MDVSHADKTVFPPAMQAKALQVIDEIIARRNRSEEVVNLRRPLVAGLVELIGHGTICPRTGGTVPKSGQGCDPEVVISKGFAVRIRRGHAHCLVFWVSGYL